MLELLGLLALIALIFGLSIGQVVTGFGQALLWLLAIGLIYGIFSKDLNSTPVKPAKVATVKSKAAKSSDKTPWYMTFLYVLLAFAMVVAVLGVIFIVADAVMQ